jgi:tRNA pseudouridine38-40 synthase
VSLQCAGRTDAGVHACGQVVHFDTPVERSMKAWVMGANINLPHDVSVSWAKVMPAHFHARFKAIARRYRYVIYNDQIRPAHLNEEITWNHRPLDVERMAEAAQYLVGTHDFSAFRAGQCQAKSPIKKMHHLRVTRHGKMIVLDIRANAFLHHMVRNIAGVLMTIGAGERPVEWMKEVLESRSAARRGDGASVWPVSGAGRVPRRVRIARALHRPHFLTGFTNLTADALERFCYHPGLSRICQVLSICQPFAARFAGLPA